MADLAGSERTSKEAKDKSKGKRVIEGASINRSLLALGNCIKGLFR
jgi:kinesin family member 18/19